MCYIQLNIQRIFQVITAHLNVLINAHLVEVTSHRVKIPCFQYFCFKSQTFNSKGPKFQPGPRNTVTGIEAERTDDRDRQIQKFEKKITVQVFTSLRPYSHCSSDFFSKLSSISGYYIVFPSRCKIMVAVNWWRGQAAG